MNNAERYEQGTCQCQWHRVRVARSHSRWRYDGPPTPAALQWLYSLHRSTIMTWII